MSIKYCPNKPTFGLGRLSWLIKSSFSVSLIMISSLSSANNISLSTQRIYLDQENPNTNFVIKNRDNHPQECRLGLTYNNFDEEGKMLPYTGSVPPQNAAEKVARYSPKNFKIEPNQRQAVKFTLRRKRDTSAIEHRSYLTVACKNIIDNTQFNVEGGLVSIPIRPQLQHNVPIIVRPRPLTLTLRFSEIELTGNALTFNLHREGTRSVYGKVKIIDLDTGDTIDESGNFAIYHETKKKNFYMTVPSGLSLNNIKLEFNEYKKEGDMVATWQVTPSND
jgi:P pilus assembly chaperone PapD